MYLALFEQSGTIFKAGSIWILDEISEFVLILLPEVYKRNIFLNSKPLGKFSFSCLRDSSNFESTSIHHEPKWISSPVGSIALCHRAVTCVLVKLEGWAVIVLIPHRNCVSAGGKLLKKCNNFVGNYISVRWLLSLL